MNECILTERLHSFAIGIVLAFVLMGVGWGAVMLTWATSSSILTIDPNRTDLLMAERSAILVSANASLPAAR